MNKSKAENRNIKTVTTGDKMLSQESSTLTPSTMSNVPKTNEAIKTMIERTDLDGIMFLGKSNITQSCIKKVIRLFTCPLM